MASLPTSLEAATSPPAAAAIVCTHCRLPVPAGLVEPEAPIQFRCAGCKTVWEILHACGMERYYELRDQEPVGDAALPFRPGTGRAYAECDDPAYQKLHVHTVGAAPGDICEVEFYLEGVHCAACVWLVERVGRVGRGGGVIETRLNFGKRLVTIRWNPARVRLSQIAATLDSLGYPPHPARLADQRALRQREDRRDIIRIGIAGACAGNAMLVAVALYAGGGGGTGGGADGAHVYRAVSLRQHGAGIGGAGLSGPGIFSRWLGGPADAHAASGCPHRPGPAGRRPGRGDQYPAGPG